MMMAAVPGTREDEETPTAPSLHDLYRAHQRSLVRLASLLLQSRSEAEEAVQDAFVKAYVAWDGLRDSDRAVAYLRSAVLNNARSRLRHLRVVERTVSPAPRLARSAEAVVLDREEHRQMIDALRRLPRRQAECLALRYYLELSEAEMAALRKAAPILDRLAGA